MSGWIQTVSGGKFHPLDPRPDEIRLSDIAHALGMQVRFTGHLDRFYSVAEHSVKVAEVVQALGGSEEAYKQALLHDASEAYLCDIATPVKNSPEFAGYRGAEENLQKAIYRKYGLPTEMLPLVKKADAILLKLEAQTMFRTLQEEWRAYLDKIKLPIYATGRVETLGWGWDPNKAREAFMSRVSDFWGKKC